MDGIRLVELVVTGLAAIATIVATHFAWRATREGKDAVSLARQTVEVAQETLQIEKQNLASLQETTRLSRQSLEFARENLESTRQEHVLAERDYVTRRLITAADAVAAIYTAATRIQNHVVTAGLELATARARLRSALAGLPHELKEARNLVHQGGDPAGLGIIMSTWGNALFEIESAIEAVNKAD